MKPKKDIVNALIWIMCVLPLLYCSVYDLNIAWKYRRTEGVLGADEKQASDFRDILISCLVSEKKLWLHTDSISIRQPSVFIKGDHSAYWIEF